MKILCLDFDGVLHSYTSGWQGADIVSDPSVPGMIDFLRMAVQHFDVHIFSSRSNQRGGIEAMQHWLAGQFDPGLDEDVLDAIKWPTEKPPAFLTIDDRAIQFTGTWPNLDELINFKTWMQGAA